MAEILNLLFNIRYDSKDVNEFCLEILILILLNGKTGFVANLIETLQDHFLT